MASKLEGLIKSKAATIAQGQPYALSLPELPERAGALPEPLQMIARQYIGARRRSGEALLDAARWLHEARALASHGDWKVFKEATSTSDDTAERLLNIHIQAMQNPQFADAIARNWLTQSAAALLARQSTPPELIEELLAAPEPPTKADIEARLRTPKHTQNPHSADFDDAIPPPQQRGTTYQQRTQQRTPPAPELGEDRRADEAREVADHAQIAEARVATDQGDHTSAAHAPDHVQVANWQATQAKHAAVIAAAQAFNTQQRAIMAQWPQHTLARQADLRSSMAHTDALLALLEEGGS
ncbi:hypothetical protein SE17_10680 [Kouleothrix aurantiaca]|uniref:Uncharacterized protein n=1 Tax=Kouleothrix aurantiaca TaxID=186479 RepID=A0A0P9DSW2_9CHLR|nr:hypothetical protein SE17_10680 [Kouleothrix aurantiaca]